MASVAVARFGGALRSSGAAARTMRSLAGPSPLARAGWVAGGGNKRCMSTVYSESHEYLIQDGEIGTVGITGFAAKALGDVVFVDLPEVGDTFEAGESFGSVESVKAASDVYAPATGEVVEINEELTETPGILNEDPMGKGWFMKIKITEGVPDTLLDPEAYEAHCEETN